MAKRMIRALALAAAMGLPVGVQARDMQVAVLAGGCFWCVEADFESVSGVEEVIPGYTGGTTENPTYNEVARGRSGHYEAVQVRFDADRVSRAQIYRLFFRAIDPTDPGGQFCDRGAAYRSAIFVASDAERALAETARTEAGETLNRRIVTRIEDLGRFTPAEAEHQDFYKSSRLTWRRFLPSSRASAYAYYRQACGRDARTRALWGDEAVFARAH